MNILQEMLGVNNLPINAKANGICEHCKNFPFDSGTDNRLCCWSQDAPLCDGLL